MKVIITSDSSCDLSPEQIKENNIPIVVFSQHAPDSLKSVVLGKGTFTVIKNK